MNFEEYDILVPNVMVMGDSNVFHFIIDDSNSIASDPRSVCGNARSFHTFESSDLEDPEEMHDEGLRACKDCVRDLQKFYDVDARSCIVCDRNNLIVDAYFRSVEIPHSVGRDNKVDVCADCIHMFDQEV